MMRKFSHLINIIIIFLSFFPSAYSNCPDIASIIKRNGAWAIENRKWVAHNTYNFESEQVIQFTKATITFFGVVCHYRTSNLNAIRFFLETNIIMLQPNHWHADIPPPFTTAWLCTTQNGDINSCPFTILTNAA